jgi:four helix bundle protein
MASTDKPRDIKQRTFEFSIKIIHLTSTFPGKKVYWIISDQLLRSATSIGANIIEGQASSSRKEFINYMHIALKSAKETFYWLELLKKSDLVKKDSIESLIQESSELSKILNSSLLTLKRKLL